MRTYGDLTYAWSDDFADWTLPNVLARRAQSHGSKVFVTEAWTGRTFTYGEVYARACSVANALLDRGFGRGDRLSIMMPNCPEYLLAWFGANIAGVIEAPINPEYRGSFLAHSVTLMTPRSIVTRWDVVESFLDTRTSLPDDLHFMLVGGAEDVEKAAAQIAAAGWTAEPFDALLAAPSNAPEISSRHHDIAALISTSGTTGPSKAVRMPYAQMHAMGESVAHALRYREDDVAEMSLPLFHAGAQCIVTYPAMLTGASIVMFEAFSATDYLRRLRTHGISVSYLLGGMMDWVWKQPPSPEDADNRLRTIWAVPVPSTIEDGFLKRFGAEAIASGFGQTEINLPIMTPYGAKDRPDGASGLLIDTLYDIRIVDPETDEEVPVGDIGEMVIRPQHPWVLSDGYWEMPAATAKSRRNLWFHTGDACRQDADGWYYFVDRMTDTLRRRGENISSLEVEQGLLQHESIAECGIIAVPADEIGGEDEVMAMLVLSTPVTFEELVPWAAERLPYFAVPRYWQVIDDMPKTPTGKTQKHLLRTMDKAGAFDREAAGITVRRRITRK